MSDALYRLSLVASQEQLDDVEPWLIATFGVYPVRLEKPCDTHGVLECYLPSYEQTGLLQAALATEFAGLPTQWSPVSEDWKEAWKKHFRPQALGERLWVHAPWHQLPPEAAGRVPVVINPGLSFGTGNHFTTRFCLEWVDRLAPSHAGAAVLDLGTGSAILAIAAVRLGLGPVLGIDHDEWAITAARDNLELNGVENHVTLEVQDLAVAFPAGTWPLVWANIYDPLLIDWAPRIWRRTERLLVLSGIRTPYVDAVAAAYQAQGAEEIARDSDPEWAGLVLERR